jgi:sugar/nucleoside kinase (ribokinase family)
MKFGTEALKNLYAKTYIFFCNKEEAVRILQLDTEADHSIQHLLLELRKLGPKLPVITDGPLGVYTFDIETADINTGIVDETTPVIHLPIYPDPLPPIERTGAGDAFASTCTTALIRGKDIHTALMWGSINSMSVCQQIGAQRGLLTEEALQGWIDKAPKDWKIMNI